MSIFSRLADIFKADVNALLDKAEDPAKMVRLMIKEMEDTLVEVRSEAVRVIAEKKDLERRLGALQDGQADWQQKAEFALTQNREDLAKAALAAKRKLAGEADILGTELTGIADAIVRYDADMAQLNAKLEEAKARRKAVEIRMKTAEKRVKIRKTLRETRINDTLERYAATERRIDDLEAQSDVFDLGRPESLDRQFADLEAEKGIEDELAAMKTRLGSDV